MERGECSEEIQEDAHIVCKNPVFNAYECQLTFAFDDRLELKTKT